MAFKVLFVCSANVCRSPSAAYLLASHLLDAGCLHKFAILSAGTDAAVGDPWCVRCRHQVERPGPDLKSLVNWEAAQLTQHQLAGAGLVLCADRFNVRDVLRGQPRARDRVFTMLEAAALAVHVMTLSTSAPVSAAGGAGAALPALGSSQERLHWLVREMDAVRGTIPRSPMGRVQRLLARHEDDGIELLDVHARGRRAHAEMVRSIRAVVEGLGPALVTAARTREERTTGR